MALYATTIFSSAFLLFLLQPIIAKAILPWFGGTAAVWTTCLLFFQLGLLVGYLYAHWSIRYLRPAKQGLLHLILMAVSILTLPILPGENWKPEGNEDPTWRILFFLLTTVGLPYVLLSTTGPLLQAWYALRSHSGADASAQALDDTEQNATKKQPFPYRLYALSNVGSMLALLGYPVLVEPYLSIRQQAIGWSVGYIGFALLCAAVAWQARKATQSDLHRDLHPRGGSALPQSSKTVMHRWGLHSYWLALAACASTLLLAVTNHLTQNVAAIPFLWVLPLSLYLLSFILCFGPKRWQWEKAFLPLAALAIAAMAYALSSRFEYSELQVLITLFSAGLLICCVLCHGELARTKPEPRYLTSFYLMVSIGGALGGVFVGLIAPRYFSTYYELPIAIAACALVAWIALYRDESRGWWRPTWLTLGLTIVGLFWSLADDIRRKSSHSRLVARNFYGVLRVNEWGDSTGSDAKRSLVHGTILHGEQFLRPERRCSRRHTMAARQAWAWR
jgi:hypothetical protein